MQLVVSLVLHPQHCTSQEVEGHCVAQVGLLLLLVGDTALASVNVNVLHVHVAVDHGGGLQAVLHPILLVTFDAANQSGIIS